MAKVTHVVLKSGALLHAYGTPEQVSAGVNLDSQKNNRITALRAQSKVGPTVVNLNIDQIAFIMDEHDEAETEIEGEKKPTTPVSIPGIDRHDH